MANSKDLARWSESLRRAKRQTRRRHPLGEDSTIAREDGAAVLRMGVVLMVVALVLCMLALIGR